MNKITSIAELQESILFLETKQANEEILIKEQFKTTYESLKPINLIKSTLSELTDLRDFKGDILGTSLSLVAGYLSKKIIFGSTRNPFKQIFGSLIQMGVTNIISKNSDSIKSFVSHLINNISSKNDESF